MNRTQQRQQKPLSSSSFKQHLQWLQTDIVAMGREEMQRGKGKSKGRGKWRTYSQAHLSYYGDCHCLPTHTHTHSRLQASSPFLLHPPTCTLSMLRALCVDNLL